MTEEVAANTVVDPGGEHPVLEGMAQGIHRVARRLEQAIGAEKLVHDRAEGGTVAVTRESLRVLLESLEGDAGERDHAAGIVRLQLPPLGFDRDVWHVTIEPDRLRRERCTFGGPVARVDHPEQQGAGLTVQPVQRAWGEQARPDPVVAEGRARLLLALLEGQLAQRQRQAQTLHRVHGLQHVAQVDQILIGGVRGDLSRFDPVEPVLAEVEHVVAGDVGDLLVADDREEVLHRLLAGRFPAAQLFFALAEGLFLGQAPIELQCLGDRDPGVRNGAEKRDGLDGIGLVGRGRDRLDALDHVLHGQLGDGPRVQIAKASRPRQITRGFVARLRVRAIPGQTGLPSLNHLGPRAIHLAARDHLRVGMQADPDGFAPLDPPVPARDAAAEVVKAASFRDAHGGEIPRLCSKLRCKMCRKSSGPNTAISAQAPIFALLSVCWEGSRGAQNGGETGTLQIL